MRSCAKVGECSVVSGWQKWPIRGERVQSSGGSWASVAVPAPSADMIYILHFWTEAPLRLRLLTLDPRYLRYVEISWAPSLPTELTDTSRTGSQSQLRFLLLQPHADALTHHSQVWSWKLFSCMDTIKSLMCSLDIKTYFNLKAIFSNTVGFFYQFIWMPESSRNLRTGWFMPVSFFLSIHFLWKGDISSEANIVLLDPVHCH